MKRRTFLKGVLGLGAAIAAPSLVAKVIDKEIKMSEIGAKLVSLKPNTVSFTVSGLEVGDIVSVLDSIESNGIYKVTMVNGGTITFRTLNDSLRIKTVPSKSDYKNFYQSKNKWSRT